MEQQTAINWLRKKLEETYDKEGKLPLAYTFSLLNKAEQMETEQFLNAFQESRLTHPMIGFKHKTFLEYYKETYGGQGSPDTTTSPTK